MVKKQDDTIIRIRRPRSVENEDDDSGAARSGLMDAKALAVYISCKVPTIRAWVARGTIPYIKIGALVRFDKREIDAWPDAKKVK